MSFFLLSSCNNNKDKKGAAQQESRQAKAMLQGIWVDEESESVTFMVKGDTIYYPDSTSLPVYFRIVGDTIEMHDSDVMRYKIVKQAKHIFWFNNQNGDVVKLVRSENPSDKLYFMHKQPHILMTNHVIKRDTVVMLGGERYHSYIAVNPTKYKVVKHTYNDDGVEVDNVYYDNIIHISVFQGANKVFSSDFNKRMFAKYVPSDFLEGAILGNMEYDKADNAGFHFSAAICIPDGESCYMVEVVISKQGKLTLKLMDN